MRLKGSERFLDVGCVDGKLSAEITRTLLEVSVLGIDLSEGMITFARNHYPQEKFPNLSFMQIDANELTFDSEFDVVFSNSVLRWIGTLEIALKGFGKVSNLRGYFLAQFEGEGNAVEVLKIADSKLEDEKWSSNFKNFVFPYGFYGLDKCDKWLKNANFSVKHLEMHSKDMAIEGEKVFLLGLLQLGFLIYSRFPKN